MAEGKAFSYHPWGWFYMQKCDASSKDMRRYRDGITTLWGCQNGRAPIDTGREGNAEFVYLSKQGAFMNSQGLGRFLTIESMLLQGIDNRPLFSRSQQIGVIGGVVRQVVCG